jgi:branched-chain amino acid transport system substrate-binding protein
MKKFLKKAVPLFLSIPFLLFFTTSMAADKPETLNVGVTAFLSGPASVFGEPAKAIAEIVVEDFNKDGGIGGVPVKLTWIDEGAGGEHLMSEYSRLVQSGNVEAMLSAISSGNCKKIAPLAEDLKILNIMWDCAAQAILEENQYEYVFRTQANGTPEMLATVLYLLKVKPDFKTVAVVNQDYAWGRDSWSLFSTILKTLKPDVKVVAEFFPKFGSPDFSAEISRLLALRPDVVLSTSWGGDLDNLVRQSVQRGLHKRTQFVLPLVESSLQRLGKDMPEGVIVGGRGDHYFLHPEYKDKPEFKAMMTRFKEKTGVYPIYSAFHMVQALNALKISYEKAIDANGGNWPDDSAQVAKAMNGLEFTGLTSKVKLRADHQGLEDQLMGTSKHVDGYDSAVLDNMMIFPAEKITTPVGQDSLSWLKTLDKSIMDIEVKSYMHGD